MAYDITYRQRALDYWAEIGSKRKTCAVFKISTSTLHEWKSQLKETGTLESRKRRPTWRKIDPDKLKAYVEKHPDAYLREIAQEFHCTIHAVEQALARLKISRKKNAIFP